MSTLRLALRPGCRVVVRETGVLQVGLDAPHRVLVRDTAAARTLLDDLGHGRLVRCPDGAEPVLRDLARHGLLVDARLLARHRRVDADLATAVFARYGDDADAVLRARSGAEVVVVRDRADRPDGGVATIAALLRASRVAVTERTCTDEVDAIPRTPGATQVWVVVGDGPVDRALLDPLVRSGRAHLVVQSGGGVVEVGPFVEPGRTACARCVDAARIDHDPRRALVLDQLLGDELSVVAPEPSLAGWAAAWAVADVVAYLDGAVPTTWSASVRLGEPGRDEPGLHVHCWARHPRCGCAWDDPSGYQYSESSLPSSERRCSREQVSQ